MQRDEHAKVLIGPAPLPALEALQRFGEAGISGHVNPVLFGCGILKTSEHARNGEHGACQGSQRERGSGRPGLRARCGRSGTRRAHGAIGGQGAIARRMKGARGLKPRAQRAARGGGTS